MDVRTLRIRLVTLACAIALLSGCDRRGSELGPVDLEPVAIADQEGAVCGMLIREQSAPRAQIIHRDGERAFVCSIGDLLAYLAAPSPHGAPARVLVEVLHPRQNPAEAHTGAHPWIPAEDAVYVVGIAREQIMGAPVLIYRDRASASQVIARTSAKILTWEELGPWWEQQQGGAPH